jgi:hypothetical protein
MRERRRILCLPPSFRTTARARCSRSWDPRAPAIAVRTCALHAAHSNVVAFAGMASLTPHAWWAAPFTCEGRDIATVPSRRSTICSAAGGKQRRARGWTGTAKGRCPVSFEIGASAPTRARALN